MFNSKIFSIINFKKYVYLVFISNFFSVLLLNDTTSFNLGLISLQSLIYSINIFFFIIFITFETISSYLDFYGLTLSFLNVVLTNPKNLNFEFNLYIFYTNLKYFLFFFLNLYFLFFSSHILKFFKIIIEKKIFILISFFIILIIIIIFNKNFLNNLNTFNDRALKKINFIIKGNFLRNDNWYIVLQNTLNYSNNNTLYSNFSFEKSFQNYANLENIYIIINESYPNFKNKDLKNKLESTLTKNLKNTDIKRFKKNWSKKYGTQGAEMELFCDQKGSWNDFQKNLDYFLKRNNCWINKYYNRYNVFIHSFEENSFFRSRYFDEKQSFFNEVFFKEKLLKLNYDICDKNVYYKGICESQIIDRLLFELKKTNNKKLVIYLTVENHIPINTNKQTSPECNNSLFNLHPQFCFLFNNQLNFNYELNKFIKKLNQNDLLVFFSDTPPIYSKRDRIHFEDYIDVFFFKKNN